MDEKVTTQFLRPEGTDRARAADAFRTLPERLLRRIDRFGVVETMAEGDVLFLAGRDVQQLMVVLDGAVDILGYTADVGPQVVVRHGVGSVVGELALITGHRSLITARAQSEGRIRRLDEAEFRRLMREEPDLSDELLTMFVARREMLRTGYVSGTIEIVGEVGARESRALRSFAKRHRIPHQWHDVSTREGADRADRAGLADDELPAVISPMGVFPRTDPGELASVLGIARPVADREADLVVIGAGPAGMAAAVYGASEGLATIVLEATAVGGQAAASSRIENYPGFPNGISGAKLLESFALQAEKFGASIFAPCAVAALSTTADGIVLTLDDGTRVLAGAVVIATGARYRTLPLERWDEFARSSIYFAATELEVRACGARPVVVVGGANSAGQAALHLAKNGSMVTIAVRGNLRDKMSAYLIDRINADPRITVAVGSSVTALNGDASLSSVEITGPQGSSVVDCSGLFCFAGAEPATSWLGAVATDEDGFILTDVDLARAASPDASARESLPFETSVPGVFAVGDVRRGSMKRVAASVGEGASAIRSVHRVVEDPLTRRV
jgi:thioredoxin reductase (NADPH)